MKKSFCIISRDKRSELLFRSAWIEAATESKIAITTLRRRDGFFGLVSKALFQKIIGNKIGTFGVSESLLMSWIRPDIVVFTGFGRLLYEGSIFRKLLFKYLLLMYRDAFVVCLNCDDYRILKFIGFTRVYKINGEGYQTKRARGKPFLNNGDFLFVGRLLKSKGLTMVLDSFIAGGFKSTTLNIVGDSDFGNSDSFTQDEIDSYVMQSNGMIKFHGYQSNLSKYYTPGAVYISASHREGLPFSVLEALDNGLVCILSRVPGHRDLGKLENVMLFDNQHELANLMKKRTNATSVLEYKAQLEIFSKESVKSEIKNIYKLIWGQ